MEQKYINSQELRDFVTKHTLANQHSIIHFNAIVSITTSSYKMIDRQFEVRISFSEFGSLGRLTLMENEIDPELFPTDFDACWQTMKHIDNTYLLIRGEHKKNSKIGRYSVNIIPLNRIAN